jgi:RecA-family ATPase
MPKASEVGGVAADLAPSLTTPAHDRDIARDFLDCLDPSTSRFTFQFFSDGPQSYAKIVHGTLDDVWQEVEAINTPERGVGVFVTINATDFKGRRTGNIVRPRALFVDADSKEQVARCLKMMADCGAKPSMIVKSSRGMHFYYLCADVPRDQFSTHQHALIDKLKADPAVKDLSRVMRLPGTLHLKDPTKPKLVELRRADQPRRWCLPELVATLGLSLAEAPTAANRARCLPDTFEGRRAPIEDDEEYERASDGLETNINEIHSAVSTIPASEFSAEAGWMKLARALAHEAARYKHHSEQLWEILDAASRRAPGYDEEDNQRRWFRYIDEAFDRDQPITIATVFDPAHKQGWQGWSPSLAMDHAWHPDELKVSFSNIPHRRWLYGVDLVRGEITVQGAPGGAGKTSLAIGMAVSIAAGRDILEEKIWGANLKTLYINAEDSGLEMKRRVWAFCLAHNVAEQDLDRLYVAGTDDARVQRLSFLRTTDKNSSVLDLDGFRGLEDLLSSVRPDLVVMDPLVALCGGGNINDNAAMSLVLRDLKRLAIRFDCAILVIHHTRKGGEPGSAEAISGAASIVNLARRAIMPVTMTREEATELNVWPSERHFYFKVVDAKSNLAPRSDETPWYQLRNIELPNADPPTYTSGDRVQAVERVRLPLPNSGLGADEKQKMRRAILDIVDQGKMIDGETFPYSPNITGAKNERALLKDAMTGVEQATAPRQWHEGDLEAAVKRSINTMKAEGWLVEEQVATGRFRRRRALRVVWPRTPWANKSSGCGTPGVPTPTEKEDLQEHAADEGCGQLVNEVVND